MRIDCSCVIVNVSLLTLGHRLNKNFKLLSLFLSSLLSVLGEFTVSCS